MESPSSWKVILWDLQRIVEGKQLQPRFAQESWKSFGSLSLSLVLPPSHRPSPSTHTILRGCWLVDVSDQHGFAFFHPNLYQQCRIPKECQIKTSGLGLGSFNPHASRLVWGVSGQLFTFLLPDPWCLDLRCTFWCCFFGLIADDRLDNSSESELGPFKSSFSSSIYLWDNYNEPESYVYAAWHVFGSQILTSWYKTNGPDPSCQ